MDRNTVIGFLLIGLVLMVWMWMNAPPPPQPGPASTDTTLVPTPQTDTGRHRSIPSEPSPPPTTRDTLGKYFGQFVEGEQRTISVETPLYRAELSTQGGGFRAFVLKEFQTWDGYPVNLIPASAGASLNLIFYSADGKIINTGHLYFQTDRKSGTQLSIAEGDSARIEFVLRVGERSRLVKSLIFDGSSYSIDAAFRFEGMENIISNFEYQLAWESGLSYAEYNSIDESNYAYAAALSGGELTEVDASSFGTIEKQSISGRVNWIAARSKYFAVAVIPREKESQGAYLEGHRIPLPDNGAKENYSIALKMPFLGHPVETDRHTVFLGPLDFDIVKRYGVELDRIMSLGAVWLIRPISEYLIIPLFQALRMVFVNYGVVLIVFAFIVKLALYPLMRTSMVSMRKMQALQPMMEEIRQKHKEDPQKMNQQIMRLYREYGVNPASGCLPLLLQLPILYALWSVFSSTIELRQASFVWWIQDLSIPDVIAELPFRLPLFGIDKISGLAVLMGLTMFIQQKMTVKDPRQKAMVWLMPIMLTLLFMSFPSGLNLYYFVFNLLSIGQQWWFNRQHRDEPLRKVEEKKRTSSLIGRLSSNIPKTRR